MAEIPDDVMKAAEAAYSDAVRGGHDTRSFGSRIEVIASAILAERERCAKLAEIYSDGVYASMAIMGDFHS